jgi:hypothetical protein
MDVGSHAKAALLGGTLLAVDHPGCAEAIDEHSKTPGGPEGPLEQHLYRSVFGGGSSPQNG